MFRKWILFGALFTAATTFAVVGCGKSEPTAVKPAEPHKDGDHKDGGCVLPHPTNATAAAPATRPPNTAQVRIVELRSMKTPPRPPSADVTGRGRQTARE